MSFLEFTTGARHPLSSANTVHLPKKPEVEVFGDCILVTAEDEPPGSSVFSVVSWKTGTYTQVSNTSLGTFVTFQYRLNAEQSSIA